MSNGASTLVTIETRCNLPTPTGPCGLVVRHHPLGAVPIIGEDPGVKVGTFINQLHAHIGKKHPEAALAISGIAARFFGYLVLKSFDTPDPDIRNAVEEIAVYLRSVSRLPAPDHIIEAKVNATIREALAQKHTADEIDALTAELQAPLVAAIKELRDYLTGQTKLPQNT